MCSPPPLTLPPLFALSQNESLKHQIQPSTDRRESEKDKENYEAVAS